jgi:hypothetical protein
MPFSLRFVRSENGKFNHVRFRHRCQYACRGGSTAALAGPAFGDLGVFTVTPSGAGAIQPVVSGDRKQDMVDFRR